MRNVEINMAQSIFEPFWDGGESYPGHKKYSVLSQYKITNQNGCDATIETIWYAVQVRIKSATDSNPWCVSMERDCKLDIHGYDILRIFASIPSEMKIRLICTIDGTENTIIDTVGKGSDEYDGKIEGSFITHIKLEFACTNSESCTGLLFWMGLTNSIKQAEMTAKQSPYTPDWEGCFEEIYEIKPELGLYFDEKELEALRKKLSASPYKASMDDLRKQANEHMKIVPENLIGTYLPSNNPRFVSSRDLKADLIRPMELLAFVGIIDNNAHMLKMACRMALSVSHCVNWCTSVIEAFPGATWHHRSFIESACSVACVKVLDWAGTMLTWHGKNIIYDAIIMKGLPRIDADIKTMDYIWNMNQGLVFSCGLITILLALSKRHPRYTGRLLEAEKDILKMWENYIFKDGGSAEGPGYWQYTYVSMLTSMILLARYYKKDLKDYVPDSIIKSGNYVLCMLSDQNNGLNVLPINDTNIHSKVTPIVCASFVNMSDDPKWKKLLKSSIGESLDVYYVEFFILAPTFLEDAEPIADKDSFISLPYTGQTSLRRVTDNVGIIHLHMQSGPILFGHSHQDKGEVILEVNKKPILIDRGTCDYSITYPQIAQSSFHNLLVPVKNGVPYSQHTKDESRSGKILEDKFDNGILLYSSDNANVWMDGIFKKNIRRICSYSPYVYIINDDVVYSEETASCFILNTYGKISKSENHAVIVQDDIQITVYTPNWTPKLIEYGEQGFDGELKAVNQLRMYTDKQLSHNLITVIEVSKVGEHKLRLKGEYEQEYGNKKAKITLNNTMSVVIDDKEYSFPSL